MPEEVQTAALPEAAHAVPRSDEASHAKLRLQRVRQEVQQQSGDASSRAVDTFHRRELADEIFNFFLL